MWAAHLQPSVSRRLSLKSVGVKPRHVEVMVYIIIVKKINYTNNTHHSVSVLCLQYGQHVPNTHSLQDLLLVPRGVKLGRVQVTIYRDDHGCCGALGWRPVVTSNNLQLQNISRQTCANYFEKTLCKGYTWKCNS